MTFLKDILKEKRDGKYSSKKIFGVLGGVLFFASYIVDGLHFYTVNESLFNTMAIFVGTLLGLRSVSKIFNKGE